ATGHPPPPTLFPYTTLFRSIDRKNRCQNRRQSDADCVGKSQDSASCNLTQPSQVIGGMCHQISCTIFSKKLTVHFGEMMKQSFTHDFFQFSSIPPNLDSPNIT